MKDLHAYSHSTDEKEMPAEKGGQQGDGPKYYLDIEGKEYSWPKDTITTEEIIELGGWDPSLGAIEIDKDNNERTLQPGEVVEIKPGHGFSKKVRWKRGSIIQDRIDQELPLLRKYYQILEYKPTGQWIRIPDYLLPSDWNRERTNVAFQIPVSYPGTPPYGIYVPIGIRYKEALPNNYQEPATTQPPFPGQWGIFSWQPDDGQWFPTADLLSGSNLLNWVRGFTQRFREGL